MQVINQLLTAGLWTNILWSRDLEPVQATNKERPILPSAWTVHLPFMFVGIVCIVHFNISCFAGVQVAPCLSRWLMIWCWFCPLIRHLRKNCFAAATVLFPCRGVFSLACHASCLAFDNIKLTVSGALPHSAKYCDGLDCQFTFKSSGFKIWRRQNRSNSKETPISFLIQTVSD